MDLEDLRPRMHKLARRYAKTPQEIEDMAQIGLIGCWLLLEQQPDASLALLVTAAERDMMGAIRHETAKKRRPAGNFVSLQAPTHDQLTLEGIVGTVPENLVREYHESLVLVLKQKYGNNYVSNMKDCKNIPYIRRRVVQSIFEAEHVPLEKIPAALEPEYFQKRGFGRFLQILYGDCAVSAVMDAFDGIFLPWDFRRVPHGYWQGRSGRHHANLATNWLINKVAAEQSRQAESLTAEDFKKARLAGMLNAQFHGSPRLAVQSVRPTIRPWEFNATPANYFRWIRNQKLALDSFLIDKTGQTLTGLTPEEAYDCGLREHVSKDALKEYGLTNLLARHKGSTYRTFRRHYAEQILPWSLNNVQEPWRDNPRATADDAMRWLIEKYLDLPRDELPRYFSARVIARVRFSGIFTNPRIGYGGSTFAVVDSLYPGKYSRDDFRDVQRGVVMPANLFARAAAASTGQTP
jgi:hypothetical protein